MNTCPTPNFEWYADAESNPEQGWWGPCTECGRRAWDHEQADPLQDLRNTIALAQNPGLRREHYPPTMRGSS